MTSLKEVQVLNKMLTNKDVELREFAKLRLKELDNPKAALERLLDDPNLRHVAEERLKAIKGRNSDIFNQLNNATYKSPVCPAISSAMWIGRQDYFYDKLVPVLESLTNEEWLIKNSEGITPLHFALCANRSSLVPKELLTEENMLLRSDYRMTLIEYVALVGQLSSLPKELLSADVLAANNGAAMKTAARRGHLDQIPKDVLAKNLLVGSEDREGANALHVAAEYGHLDQIPPDILTTELWLNKDDYTSVFMRAIRHGDAAQVPKCVWTVENLLEEDGWKKYALEELADIDDLDVILGVSLPEKYKCVVGLDWFEKNLAVVEHAKENNRTNEPAESPDISIF